MSAEPARKHRFPENISREDVRTTEAILARTLKMFREAAGLTQEEAAREIGATVSALTKWEHGVSVPRPEWLTALAELYECSVGNLFGEITEDPKKRRKR